MNWVRAAIAILGGLLMLVTALPLVLSNEWWIRVWDFPRMQVAVLIGAVLLAAPMTLDRRRPRSWALAVGLLGALAYQLLLIWPYTPLKATEVALTASCPATSRVRLLIANVLMTNRSAEPLLEYVRQLDPDVVLLVETDAWWDGRLEGLKASYPYVVSKPREDFYGMHFFSRFELVDPKVRFLIDEYVPSLRTGVRLPSGALIDFHGVHSKPPPQHDTARRDAELLLTAREVRETRAPSIVAGVLESGAKVADLRHGTMRRDGTGAKRSSR